MYKRQLQFPTWAEFTIVYVAVLKVGGVVHPVPRNYNDVDLEYAMNLVGSRAYLSPTFSHNTDSVSYTHLGEA